MEERNIAVSPRPTSSIPDIPLDDRFNSRGSTKFLRLNSGVPEEYVEEDKPSEDKSPQDDYEAMTIEELREVADAEEIDLGNLTLKNDIIASIKSATE